MLAPVFDALMNMLANVPTIGPTAVAAVNLFLTLLSDAAYLGDLFLNLIGY